MMVTTCSSTLDLPLAAFRDWLESHEGREPVGRHQSPTDSVLVRWVRARLWPQAVIVRGQLRPAPGAPWEDLPEWCLRYEARLARVVAYRGRGWRGPVAALVALRGLDE
jgi:hypothetical protein